MSIDMTPAVSGRRRHTDFHLCSKIAALIHHLPSPRCASGTLPHANVEVIYLQYRAARSTRNELISLL